MPSFFFVKTPWYCESLRIDWMILFLSICCSKGWLGRWCEVTWKMFLGWIFYVVYYPSYFVDCIKYAKCLSHGSTRYYFLRFRGKKGKLMMENGISIDKCVKFQIYLWFIEGNKSPYNCILSMFSLERLPYQSFLWKRFYKK